MLSAIYRRERNNEVGFTLIELLVVVIIIGLLAAIALPIFIDQQKVAIDASVKADVRNSVTNITNAQAQKQGSAKAAVSQSGTHVALTADDFTSQVTYANRATASFTNVPELGTTYAVDGWNAAGKQYLGTSAKPAYEFNSASGKFTSSTAASPADVPAPGVANDSDFSGTLSSFSFNSYTGAATAGTSGNAMTASQLRFVGGLFSVDGNADTTLAASNFPAANGMQPYDAHDSGAREVAITNVVVKNASGKTLATPVGNCSIAIYYLTPETTKALLNVTVTKNVVLGELDCSLTSNGGSSALASTLNGGTAAFTDQNGVRNTLQLTAATQFLASGSLF